MPGTIASAGATDSGVSGRWRHLPNALTVLRLVLALLFFAVLTPWKATKAIPETDPPTLRMPEWPLLLAALVFVLAAATDWLDGFLARRWKAETAFGRVMDPFADKLLIIGAAIYLAGPGFQVEWMGRDGMVSKQISGVYPWMVVAILARELLVTSIRAVLEGDGVKFAAGWSGKMKMGMQSVAVPGVLVILAFFDAWPATPARWIVDGIVWATVAVTLLSAVPYIRRAVIAFRDTRRDEA